MLGVCLDAQLISEALDGEVMPTDTLEVGWHEVEWFADADSGSTGRKQWPLLFKAIIRRWLKKALKMSQLSFSKCLAVNRFRA